MSIKSIIDIMSGLSKNNERGEGLIDLEQLPTIKGIKQKQ